MEDKQKMGMRLLERLSKAASLQERDEILVHILVEVFGLSVNEAEFDRLLSVIISGRN